MVSNTAGSIGADGTGSGKESPSATRESGASRWPTKPKINCDRIFRAAAAAKRLARIVPLSQKQWRYVRAWYFHALRQNVDALTITEGACLIDGSPPLARTMTAR